MDCQICHGVFHPDTGVMVGAPTEFRACGSCRRELVSLLKVCDHRNRFSRTTPRFYDAARTSVRA